MAKKAPRAQFALPDKKAFPLNTPGRVKLAPSAAARSYAAGNITKAEELRVQRAAAKKRGPGATTSANKSQKTGKRGGR